MSTRQRDEPPHLLNDRIDAALERLTAAVAPSAQRETRSEAVRYLGSLADDLYGADATNLCATMRKGGGIDAEMLAMLQAEVAGEGEDGGEGEEAEEGEEGEEGDEGDGDGNLDA